MAKVFGEEAFKAVGDLALREYKKAAADAKQAGNTEAYNEAIKRKEAWGAGGTNEVLLHTVVGGLASSFGGNGFASGAVSAGASEASRNLLKNLPPELQQWGSAIIGATATKLVGGNGQTGASTAVTGVVNNGLDHDQQVKLVNDLIYALDNHSSVGIVTSLLKWSAVDQWNSTLSPGMGEGAEDGTIRLLNSSAKELGISFNYDQNDSVHNNMNAFWGSLSSSVPTIDTSTLIAGGAIGTAVVVGTVTLYNYKGVLVKAAGTGTVTGTVWDKITPIASNLPGTAIPATFQLQAAQRVLYVNSNATKHMAENINRFGAESWTAEVRSQAMLSSFNSAVQQGVANLATSAPGRYFINVGGWELGINTETGVIYHALFQ